MSNEQPDRRPSAEPSDGTRTIHVILSNTMANEEWDLNPPVDVQAHVLLRKIVVETGARERDEGGILIPYRLMWTEGDRYLAESETLKQAGVQDGHHLVLAYEARAGADVNAR